MNIKNERVVITGMGVVAPNGHGLKNFEQALRNGISGIRHHEHLAEANFACQVGGIPQNIDNVKILLKQLTGNKSSIVRSIAEIKFQSKTPVNGAMSPIGTLVPLSALVSVAWILSAKN